jgi:O-methyltransferase
MSFRYNPIQKWTKIIYRRFNPIPGSPWTKGQVDDICKINLVPPETLKIFFTDCIKELQAIKGRDIGDYLEFGVFNGSSLGSAYLTAKKMNLKSMKFFGFDSFEGLPDGTNEEHDILQKGFYCCPFEKTKECLKRRGVDPKEIVWIKGVYNETLNDETIKKIKLGRIGIVFIDCDTYSSSKTVLDFLAPLITEPAIVCLDDWKLYDMDIKGTGEYKSFNEFLEKNRHIKAKEIKSYNRKSRSFLLIPKVTPKN